MMDTERADAGGGLAYLDGLNAGPGTGQRLFTPPGRVAELLGVLGDPQRAYPVIHVTGTNGKSSTTAMVASLLTGQGLSVGAYSSPHVDRLSERISVNGEPVGEGELAEALDAVAWAAGRTGVTPSWFEAITAAGFWLLAERHVEAAVIEVGMLGTRDATNVVDGAVAVITNVALDHVDIAGPTRAAIAVEKSGIIKPGATLVLGEPDPDLRGIFAARRPGRILTKWQELTWSERRAVPLGSIVDLENPWGRRNGISVRMAGAHQCGNALLALTAAEALLGAAIPAAAVNAALTGVQLAGRFEVIGTGPAVILDGAHNPAAAGVLRRLVENAFGDAAPRVIVCGTLDGRDPVQFLEQLGVADAELLITTQPGSSRALAAERLAEAAAGFGVATRAIADPELALDAAVTAAGPEGLVVATGSLYLLGRLRAAAERVTL